MPRLFGAACFLDVGLTRKAPNRYPSESGHSHPRPEAGCVPARQFDGAERPRFQQWRECGSGFASGDRDCSACQNRHDGRLSPGVRNHPINPCGLRFEKRQAAVATKNSECPKKSGVFGSTDKIAELLALVVFGTNKRCTKCGFMRTRKRHDFAASAVRLADDSRASEPFIPRQ